VVVASLDADHLAAEEKVTLTCCSCRAEVSVENSVCVVRARDKGTGVYRCHASQHTHRHTYTQTHMQRATNSTQTIALGRTPGAALVTRHGRVSTGCWTRARTWRSPLTGNS